MLISTAMHELSPGNCSAPIRSRSGDVVVPAHPAHYARCGGASRRQPEDRVTRHQWGDNSRSGTGIPGAPGRRAAQLPAQPDGQQLAPWRPQIIDDRPHARGCCEPIFFEHLPVRGRCGQNAWCGRARREPRRGRRPGACARRRSLPAASGRPHNRPCRAGPQLPDQRAADGHGAGVRRPASPVPGRGQCRVGQPGGRGERCQAPDRARAPADRLPR